MFTENESSRYGGVRNEIDARQPTAITLEEVERLEAAPGTIWCCWVVKEF